MSRRRGLLVAGAAAALVPAIAQSQTPGPAAPRIGELKPLGAERYQIGRLVIDKRARRFTVPGRLIVTGKPLEFLAGIPGAKKAYETMLELDTSGSEFNVACILIGLERDPRMPRYRRPGEPLLGPRVALSVAWFEGAKRVQVSAAEAMLNADTNIKPETVEWLYAGSYTVEQNGVFAADVTGVLISLIPNGSSIIESAVGIGVGAYGLVRGHAMLPPVGTAIELVVEAVNAPK
jgi:hypothetical protein